MNIDFEHDIHFILGYLDQCRKMNHAPEKIIDILLFLTNEIKKIKEGNKL